MKANVDFRQRLGAIARRPRVRRSFLGLGIAIVLMTLFGYFVLPGIIKSQAESLVSEALHRRISIQDVEVSPYALAVSIKGMRLMEPDGSTVFAAFDELRLNFSAESLFQLAPVVQEAQLIGPYVHLARTEAHRYNFDDIVELIARQPASATPVRFSIFNIRIEAGRIKFEDHPEGTTHTISDLALGIPFISSLPSQVAVFVEPSLSAKVNGTPLKLRGKTRPFGEPMDAVLDLSLENLDLTRYLGYLPYSPSFRLPSARLDLQLTASFRQPKGKSPTLILKGDTKLRSVQITDLKGKSFIKLPELAITWGEVDVFAGRYGIAKVLLTNPDVSFLVNKAGGNNLALLAPPPSPGKHEAVVQSGAAAAPENTSAINLTLGELGITGGTFHFDDQQPGRPLGAEIAKLDLNLSGISLDMQKHQLNVGELRSDSAKLKVQVGARQSIPAHAGRVDGKEPATAGAGKKLAFSLGKLSIDRWSAHIADSSLAQPVATLLEPISLDGQNISNGTGQVGSLDIRTGVNQKGQASISGNIGIAPLHAALALALKDVDILSLQPYLTDHVNLLVTRASLTTQGKLVLDSNPDGELQGGFKGDLTLGNLATVDKVNANDFLRWKSLYLGGMDVQLAPFSLVIDQVALNDFFARLIIDANGRINLQDIQRSHADGQVSLTDADVIHKASAASKAAAETQPLPIRIRKASLQGGRVRFTDNFIKPHYSATLEELGGMIKDLSSEASSTASVDLRGKVNGAPLEIAGRVNPLKGDLFLDLKANVQGMELAPLSSYSGKYVGYDIEKGKLSFEVAYQVNQRKLTAQNRLVLDQLTFGEKIESPTATSLPVHLAVALLRDSNGVIDINLPVSGSLDDPDFSLGSIIVKVIVNLVTKAVTAPFALLGSLFGGGEELSWLEFDAGRYAVPQSGMAKLQSLGKALRERPALKLEIAGRIDPASDREGLRRVSVERKVRALKLKDLIAKNESADAANVVVKPEEYPALLSRVYRDENIPKPRNLLGMAKELPVSEMEKLLTANAQTSDDDLAMLAGRRAQAVKDALLKSGEVDAARLFIVTIKAAPTSAEVGRAPARRADLFLR